MTVKAVYDGKSSLPSLISPMRLNRPPTPEPTRSFRPATPLRELLSPSVPATPEHRNQLLRSPFPCLPTNCKKGMQEEGEEERRLLITVYVVGSPGPLRMVVRSRETVEDVIRSVLRLYSHQGRLPAVGSDPAAFELYCVGNELGALDVQTELLSCGSRSFHLCRNANSTPAKGMEKSKSFNGKLSKLKAITICRLGLLSPFVRSISFN